MIRKKSPHWITSCGFYTNRFTHTKRVLYCMAFDYMITSIATWPDDDDDVFLRNCCLRSSDENDDDADDDGQRLGDFDVCMRPFAKAIGRRKRRTSLGRICVCVCVDYLAGPVGDVCIMTHFHSLRRSQHTYKVNEREVDSSTPRKSMQVGFLEFLVARSQFTNTGNESRFVQPIN